MLRTGDTIRLSVNPTISIADFKNLKPSASISRVIGDDVEGDLAEVREELQSAIYEAIAMELGVLNEMAQIIDSATTIEEIAEVMARKVRHVTVEEEPAGGRSQKSSAKKPCKKRR